MTYTVNNNMKIYYSHAMPLYGTEKELNEKQSIVKNMPNITIVDPGSFQDNIEKRNGGMEYCLNLVEKCNGLVFTRFLNKITAGVGKEVNHAIKKKILVHELKNGKLRKVTKPVKYLSREDTVKMYRVWRIKQLFAS